LSEALKVSSFDLREWLKSETSSVFVPIHNKAERLIEKIRRALDNVEEVSRMLLKNSNKEIEKRNKKTYGRARALNKLARLFIDRVKQVKIPEEVSYENFSEFVDETKKVLAVTEIDVRTWFPRISPFFILDRRKFLTVFEKAKESFKELNEFLVKEYVKARTLEETFQLIDKLLSLEEQLKSLENQKEKTENEKDFVKKRTDETRQKIEELKSKGSLSQLSMLNMEVDKLKKELEHKLRHLRKPFIKFQRLVEYKGGLTPEELRNLKNYINDPFEAFSREQTGYPVLKQILGKLSQQMSEGKLKLKPDKKRKAERDIDAILEKNSLATIHQKCLELITQIQHLSTSAEISKTRNELHSLQEKLKELADKKEILESKEKSLKQAYNETLEKIRKHKNQIERNIFSFLGKRVKVV
jgi:hypothetical protein